MTPLGIAIGPIAAMLLAFSTGAPPHLDQPEPAGPSSALTAQRPTRWSWPLAPRPKVLRPFLPPASRWGEGHRGVDLASHSGQAVLAVDAGTVAHVGVVAGRGTVTVLHPSGVRSTYEPVAATVSTGATVARGMQLGTLRDVGSHCAPVTCLHLGALRDATYLNPLTLLGPVSVRLLPMP
ncbi:M23 family metallopeptidase [Pedococcus sp. 5OH_020]|uniref:M23 family metallopeptidase n=1 Tax=Pedococcus sp. 5OH_020 TaxID=2989814 RepID=UPI0022E9D6B6|nr:M23 family metallopeptidase [Pedococcus sp. 5OH_020]